MPNTKKIEDLLKEKKIVQVINDRVVQAPPSISLKEAIQQMQFYRSGYIILTEDGIVVGILTETDVIQNVLTDGVDMNRPVSDFMISMLHTLSPEASVGEAIDLMAKKKISHLPLTDENHRYMGMLSVRTLIRFLAAYYPTEIYNLPPDPQQITQSREGG
jgi:signal-transduction protein with cAMP-binding, CBS, and nucleotidyltransferase domain